VFLSDPTCHRERDPKSYSYFLSIDVDSPTVAFLSKGLMFDGRVLIQILNQP
jgi:hypothetical protein